MCTKYFQTNIVLTTKKVFETRWVQKSNIIPFYNPRIILWQRNNLLSADIIRENDSPNKSKEWGPRSANNVL